MSRRWGLWIVAACVLLVAAYIIWHRRKQKTPA